MQLESRREQSGTQAPDSSALFQREISQANPSLGERRDAGSQNATNTVSQEFDGGNAFELYDPLSSVSAPERSAAANETTSAPEESTAPQAPAAAQSGSREAVGDRTQFGTNRADRIAESEGVVGKSNNQLSRLENLLSDEAHIQMRSDSGAKSDLYPGTTSREVLPNGDVKVQYDDGSSIQIQSDGKGGQVITGSGTLSAQNFTEHVYQDADGTDVVEHKGETPEESWTRREANGIITEEFGDGKRVEMKGNPQDGFTVNSTGPNALDNYTATRTPDGTTRIDYGDGSGFVRGSGVSQDQMWDGANYDLRYQDIDDAMAQTDKDRRVLADMIANSSVVADIQRMSWAYARADVNDLMQTWRERRESEN